MRPVLYLWDTPCLPGVVHSGKSCLFVCVCMCLCVCVCFRNVSFQIIASYAFWSMLASRFPAWAVNVEHEDSLGMPAIIRPVARMGEDWEAMCEGCWGCFFFFGTQKVRRRRRRMVSEDHLWFLLLIKTFGFTRATNKKIPKQDLPNF